jgi:hypothetical protein
MPMIYSPTSTISVDNYVLSSSYNYSYPKYSYNMLNNKVLVYDDSPVQYVPVGTSYVIPSITTPYLDLNLDERVHKRFTKYFYYKILDDWLFDDLVDSLAYLKYNTGTKKVSFTENGEKDTSRETQESVEAKIKFIEDGVMTRNDVYKILKRLVSESKINWYDLPKIHSAVKDVVRMWLKKNLRK